MKPLVSTSVYGLVPLPQLPESTVRERDHCWAAQPQPAPDLEHNEELASCHCKAQRKLILRQWFFTIWRQREADR